MPKGVYERKPRMENMDNTEATLFPVKLNRNYVPRGQYEVIGYLKAEVKRKTPAGTWAVVEKEQFIDGEMMPPATPGVGYPDKVWAGTHIRLPVDEAKDIIAKKIADRADAIAA